MSSKEKIIPLDKFINQALYDPKNGFYMKKNPFGEKGDFIMSKEGDGLHKLSNAIMLSKKGAEFPQTWLGRYTNFNDDVWVEHSIELPYTLAEEFPNEITILGHKAFAWPLYHSEHLRWFFRNGVDYAKCDYSDGIVLASPDIEEDLLKYVSSSNKPFMKYPGDEDYIDAYESFYEQFVDKEDLVKQEDSPKVIEN